MTRKAKILLVEDDAVLSTIYMETLLKQPCELICAETGKEARKAIKQFSPDLVFLDLFLPDDYGLDILDFIKKNHPSITVIVVTAEDSLDIAIKTMQSGAFDYLVKPVSPSRLMTTMQNLLERHELKNRLNEYEEKFLKEDYCDFIGSSLPMQVIYQTIASAATSKATVFINGESGTGKELCARAIHDSGPRKNGPFISLNCAAIPGELMESELFGHIKGAFTGATANRIGAASLADGGTLFFDEICEMELALQSKLLRFVQSRTFQKVGSNQQESADIRFVCATNRDPFLDVKEGRFREDLFYRFYVVPIELPPLRIRENDIMLLARHFLFQFTKEENKQFRNFSREVEHHLLNYSWPGNVRQLENLVRSIVVLCEGDTVTTDMLPATIRLSRPQEGIKPEEAHPLQLQYTDNISVNSHDIRPMWQIEKETIENAINICKGDVAEASKRLGISDSTIYRKRRRWKELSNKVGESI